MYRSVVRLCGLAVAAGLAGVLSAPAVPASVPAAAGSSAGGTAVYRAAPSALTGATRAVTLITGDSIRLRTDATGRTLAQAIPAFGAHAGFQTVRTADRTLVIPAIARPYLGRLLDPELFDVSAQGSAGAGAQIPVRLTFTGAAVPAVPGVTITARATGAASGYLTPASARSFGAALAAAYRVDARAHFPRRASLFGVTRIIADIAVAPVVTPLFPMRTLIVKVLDSGGAPAPFGFLDILNTDNSARFIGFAFVVDGEARVSVPLGTYAFDTGADVVDAAGNFGGFAVITRSDYRVSTQNQTLTLDARAATSRLSVRTPRPAEQQSVQLDLTWQDAAGGGQFGSGFAVLGPGAITVAPAMPPVSGTLTSDVAWNLTGAPLSGPAYAYSLHFPGVAGISADQAYRVRAEQLAAFVQRFYVDVLPRQGAVITAPIVPGGGGGFNFSFPVPLPSNLRTYVNAIPDAGWETTLFASPDPFTNPFAGLIDDGLRRAPAGSAAAADWGRGPALQSAPYDTGTSSALFGFGFDCPMCRTAQVLRVALNLAGDTTPGHVRATLGNLDGTPVTRLRIYRDGTLIYDATDTGLAEVKIPAGSGIYRVLDDLDRRPSLALQSLATRTDITFSSAAGSGGTPPAGWSCSLGAECTVLPLLQAAVGLPTSLTGSVPIGTSTITLQVSHIQGAPAAAVTSGRVETRRPGGQWTALPVTDLGGGSYRAQLTTSAADAGTSIDLRVTGTDTVGGRIQQTATSAFAVAGS